jgi:DNA-binding NtrC family response regulator
VRQLDSVFLGTSEFAQRTRRWIEFVAPRRAPVVVEGPTGSGKTLVAGELHRLSGRAGDEPVRVPMTLLQGSDLLYALFAGHEAGAFTGAQKDAAGYIQQADGSTLFIEDLQDACDRSQATLVEVAEQRPIRPVGATRLIRPDLRIIAATQVPLAVLVAEGKFRGDLAHRFGVVTVGLVPLCQRLEDLPSLVPPLLAGAAAREGFRVPEICPTVLATFGAYGWPGNIRELEAVLTSALFQMYFEDEGARVLERRHLPAAIQAVGGDLVRLPRRLSPDREAVRLALVGANGNVSRAAAAIGVRPESAWRMVRRFGLNEFVDELRRREA